MSPIFRVALLSEHASPLALLGGVDAGGQNVYIDEVARNLAALGHRVDVFTRRDNPTLPEIVAWAPGVRVIHLDAGPPEFVLKDQLWPLMPQFRDAALRFIARDGAQYDVLHGNFWMSGWVAAELRQELGVPAVQIFHATGLTKRRHQGQADTSPPERVAVEKHVVAEVERVIAQCPAEADELLADYGATPDTVALIPSAVNTTTFQPVDRDVARRQIGLVGDELVVVYVGRMLPRKDVRNVVRAVALLIKGQRSKSKHGTSSSFEPRNPQPAVRLLLVGGETREPDRTATPEIGVLQDMAAELGIAAQVTFVGKRQPDELRFYYGAGDVAVTTPWYEPFGLTPLEGQACGRPMIGSAVGGITFTIQDGMTGVLVPPRDPHALAAALRALLSDEARRIAMGQAARARVEREFTWAMVARRTAQLYAEVKGKR
jgi:D-inositol-3-phosphate glycosyltransferase